VITGPLQGVAPRGARAKSRERASSTRTLVVALPAGPAKNPLPEDDRDAPFQRRWRCSQPPQQGVGLAAADDLDLLGAAFGFCGQLGGAPLARSLGPMAPSQPREPGCRHLPLQGRGQVVWATSALPVGMALVAVALASPEGLAIRDGGRAGGRNGVLLAARQV